jgi:hypothetical protein
MESLESKLDCLSPEQRKEIEDFVDFLLLRSGQVRIPPGASRDPPPVLNIAPPPLILIEPMPPEETRPVRLEEIARPGDRADAAGSNDAGPAPFHEIGGGVQERITHDYMDYGQFESPPSPATDAVKKVKRQLIAREGQDKPRHLLDWVD